MNRFFESIGNALTSMSAIIFVLAMVIASGTFFSHTLFYEVFPKEMAEWEKSIATWTLACAWELTILITTVNTNYISKRIPPALAVCSGLIIIMFLHGFDPGLPLLDYCKRFFIGILVAYINIIFSSLFLSAWRESRTQMSLAKRLADVEAEYNALSMDLLRTKSELVQSRKDFDQLFIQTEELEKFKHEEIMKRTCECGRTFESVYQMHSHKSKCNLKLNLVKKINEGS